MLRELGDHVHAGGGSEAVLQLRLLLPLLDKKQVITVLLLQVALSLMLALLALLGEPVVMRMVGGLVRLLVSQGVGP